jgi:hypothetical protein
MPGSKLVNVAAGLFFLVVAGLSLYRLLFWFPITIGGAQIGQTASFFSFVIFAALSLIMFLGTRNPR